MDIGVSVISCDKLRNQNQGSKLYFQVSLVQGSMAGQTDISTQAPMSSRPHVQISFLLCGFGQNDWVIGKHFGSLFTYVYICVWACENAMYVYVFMYFMYMYIHICIYTYVVICYK